MTEEKAHYWNRIAKAWQEAYPKTLWRAYNDAVNASLFARWLPSDRVENLLKTDLFDESLGDGLYPLLASRAKNIVGMDISILTSHNARSRRGGLKAVNADVRHLPFANGTFDVIVSNSTLDHFKSSDDIVASLRELNRVLRAGGQLVLTLDNLANPIIALRNALPFRLLNHLNIVPYYVGTTFGPSRLCHHLSQVGLEVLEVSAVMHFPRIFTMAMARIIERHAKREIKTIKRNLSRFCLVLASLCISLFLAEGFVRIFFPHSRDHVVPSGLFDIDDYLGWKLMAGKSVTHHSHYFNAVYTINSLGFRDKPRNVLKDKNVYRILLYGDSQIFGWGVPEDKRFSNLIENQMRHIEIWNLAVPGYGLDQEILSYERDGKPLNADEVIFFVSGNTLERTRYNYIYKKHKPMFVIDETGTLQLISIPKEKAATTSLLYKILSPMYLPYFLERRSEMLKDVLKKSSYSRNRGTNTESIIPRERMGDFEKKMFIMAKNMALERKQRITILAELPKAKSKDLEDFCNQNEIGFLKIAFDDNNEKQGLVFGKYDYHWNLQGHKLVAQQLLSQMEKMSNGGERVLLP